MEWETWNMKKKAEENSKQKFDFSTQVAFWRNITMVFSRNDITHTYGVQQIFQKHNSSQSNWYLGE